MAKSSNTRNFSRSTERDFPKHTKCINTQSMNKCIGMLFILSMAFIFDIEIAGVPCYILILFLGILAWTVAGAYINKRNGRHIFPIRNRADIAAYMIIIYEMISAVFLLFSGKGKGADGFSGKAVIVSLSMLYLLLTGKIQFRKLYFDFIAYSGLLVSGIFILDNLTDMGLGAAARIAWKDSGEAASYLLLVCMSSAYLYWFCKDKMKTAFYFLVSAITYFALLLNRDILSFWILLIYFIAAPIILRPTAKFVKRDMQLLFLFVFMLSNMSLFMGYTAAGQKKMPYSLQHSIYLDLLLLIGGLFFFHYWDKIPENIDLERLVLRKMRRGYQFLLKIILVFLFGFIIAQDRWRTSGETASLEIVNGFAVPLIEGIRQNESSLYHCFYHTGAAGGILAVVLGIVLTGKMHRRLAFDKPVTGILILVSSLFLVQLLFWKPGVNTLIIYWVLLLFAVHGEEERVKVMSIKLRKESLKELRINIQGRKGSNIEG